MQFYPRVRARNETARVRNYGTSKDAKLLGFAGYKVGMTHMIVTDNLPNSLTKGQDLFMPVTIVECPPIKAVSLKFYKTTQGTKKVVGEVKLQRSYFIWGVRG